ncbi:serine/threonine-protein kinase [Solwaraspora sp. WMMD406]|uniref:serine/threonine-protein kinase n=1 Tax=Solwaraspora sp. WMMD406 TaxID=3016095 RepID=UPI002416ECA0|nr:serine/threonine-protein kinase [Solwaraspora sp. WMMD406]MDG4764986.1 serine/threonine-protein kinase [Solwaraspora sp. WMMD406]
MTWLRAGTTILRRYVVLCPIGQGGVSVVYRAVDVQSARPLAVKLLAPAAAGDPRPRDDVRHEAMIAERLRHPSVPRVYDVGELPLGAGASSSYIVMELFAGRQLAHRLADGAIAWRDAVRVAATAADLLAVAHRRGVVHRDLTPHNVILAATGAKIVDFGLAALVDGSNPAGPPRPSDDVYALGVLLYHMLTGRSPYPGQSGSPVGGARHSALAPTPVLAVAGLPRAVADLCRRCMSKQPEARPTSSQAALALWGLLDQPAPLGHPGLLDQPAPLGRSGPLRMPTAGPPVAAALTPAGPPVAAALTPAG